MTPNGESYNHGVGLAPLRFPSTIGALAALGLALAALGGPAESQRLPAGPFLSEESRSLSIGYGNRGRLQRSVELEPSEQIRLKNGSTAYGTMEMVELLQWSVGEVNRHHPGSSLLVGDISRRRGGRLRPHRSHRAGRDADIGFFLKTEDGEPADDVRRFIRLRANGKGSTRDGDVYVFDDARNWAFVAALMEQDAVPVQYLMVIRPLRIRLLEEGRRQGAPQWLLDRVDQAVGPRPGRGSRRTRSYGIHDSHFHIRIYCAADDRPRCRDQAPFWPWVNYPEVEDDSASNARRRRSRGRRQRSRRRGSRGSSMRR